MAKDPDAGRSQTTMWFVDEIRKLRRRPDAKRLVGQIDKLRERPDTKRLVNNIGRVKEQWMIRLTRRGAGPGRRR